MRIQSYKIIYICLHHSVRLDCDEYFVANTPLIRAGKLLHLFLFLWTEKRLYTSRSGSGNASRRINTEISPPLRASPYAQSPRVLSPNSSRRWCKLSQNRRKSSSISKLWTKPVASATVSSATSISLIPFATFGFSLARHLSFRSEFQVSSESSKRSKNFLRPSLSWRSVTKALNQRKETSASNVKTYWKSILPRNHKKSPTGPTFHGPLNLSIQ